MVTKIFNKKIDLKYSYYVALYGIFNIFNQVSRIFPLVLLVMVLIQLGCSSISTVYCMDSHPESQAYFFQLRRPFTETTSLGIRAKEHYVNHIWTMHVANFEAGTRESMPPASQSQLLDAVNGRLERDVDTEHIFEYLNNEYIARNIRCGGFWLEETPAPMLVVDAVLQDPVAVATSDITQQSTEPEVPPLPNESMNPMHK